MMDRRITNNVVGCGGFLRFISQPRQDVDELTGWSGRKRCCLYFLGVYGSCLMMTFIVFLIIELQKQESFPFHPLSFVFFGLGVLLLCPAVTICYNGYKRYKGHVLSTHREARRSHEEGLPSIIHPMITTTPAADPSAPAEEEEEEGTYSATPDLLPSLERRSSPINDDPPPSYSDVCPSPPPVIFPNNKNGPSLVPHPKNEMGHNPLAEEESPPHTYANAVLYNSSLAFMENPGTSSSGRLSPGRASPRRQSPGRISPRRVSPGRVSPNRIAPSGRISPHRAPSGRVSPRRASPGRLSPHRASPVLICPGRGSPGRVSPSGDLPYYSLAAGERSFSPSTEFTFLGNI